MSNLYLSHHGIKGQKWGVRRYQNYDGTRINRVFVSGSSKTTTEDSGYYRKELHGKIKKSLDDSVKKGHTIIVGDAPGIDSQVQDYLKKYMNVEVYTSNKDPRYLANKKWKVNRVDSKGYEPGTPEFLAEKDKAMTNSATRGLAIILENGGAGATRRNVDRLISQNKDVKVFELRSDNSDDYIKYK